MSDVLPTIVRITEVGPRDGLQNEPDPIATEAKVAFIDLLSRAGFAEIEISSFVSPRWVPQLGDAAEVFAGIARNSNVVYAALVPNQRGLDAALAAGADKVSVFTAASESFSSRNTNATIGQTLDRFAPVIKAARDARKPVRAYISCVVACPYEGPIDPIAVRDVAQRLIDLGVDEIDLGETIGVAAPTDIGRLYDRLDGVLSPGESTLHLHDTRGTALACAYRAMQLGVRSFDASAGGLGGCPYAPGAAGNLATEDLVYLCDAMGVATDVDLDMVISASSYLAQVIGREPRSRVYAARSRELNSAPTAVE